MSDLTTEMAGLCEAYAKALCAAREQQQKADDLYDEMAGEEVHEVLRYLDAIKRVMEIDTEVTDPTIVLLRVSVT